MTGGPTLRDRIIAGMVATALVTSLLFGAASLFLAFTVEDHRFTSALAREIAHQKSHWTLHGAFAPPLEDYIRVYPEAAQIPPDLAASWHPAEPHGEHAGDNGRHYYYSQFSVAPGRTAVAVAEVGHLIVVAPNLAGVIKFLAVIGALVAAAAAAVGYALANRALKPLKQLAVDAVSQDAAVPEIEPSRYPSGEVGQLAQALAQSFHRIGAFVAREKAFTRDASHELRTPLSVIRSSAELARTQSAERQMLSLKRIEAATEEMDATLDLLLAIAREEGAATAKARAALLPLIERAILNASGRFPASGVKVTVNLDDHAQADINAPLVQLLLNNIIANAFQHAGGSELTIEKSGNVLVIADTGPGLAKDSIAPFSKGPASEGTGLGLSIVRRLCEKAKVGLDIDSSPGKGTTFRLRLT